MIDTVTAPLQDTVRTILILRRHRRHHRPGGRHPRRPDVGRRRGEAGVGQPGARSTTSWPRTAGGCSGRRLAVGLFILVVWNKPTTLVAVVVVLVTLAVIGLVGLLAGRPLRPGRPPDWAAGMPSRADDTAGVGRCRSDGSGAPGAVAADRSGARRHLLRPGVPDRLAATGLRGFWMGYFAGRAAPLGAGGTGTVSATFFNFHPSMVERSIPDAWTFAEPTTVLRARRAGAAAALRRLVPSIGPDRATARPPPGSRGRRGRRLRSAPVQCQPRSRRRRRPGGGAVAGLHLAA